VRLVLQVRIADVELRSQSFYPKGVLKNSFGVISVLHSVHFFKYLKFTLRHDVHKLGWLAFSEEHMASFQRLSFKLVDDAFDLRLTRVLIQRQLLEKSDPLLVPPQFDRLLHLLDYASMDREAVRVLDAGGCHRFGLPLKHAHHPEDVACTQMTIKVLATTVDSRRNL
jgi:hypothetical protein